MKAALLLFPAPMAAAVAVLSAPAAAETIRKEKPMEFDECVTLLLDTATRPAKNAGIVKRMVADRTDYKALRIDWAGKGYTIMICDRSVSKLTGITVIDD